MADPKDDSAESSEKSWLAEAVRELTATGLAAVFMTEDSIRGYLREKKFPKELVGLLTEGIGKKKDDLYSIVAKEVGRVFAKVDISREISKFLEDHRVRLEAKITFEPKEGLGSKEEKNS